MGLRVTSPVKTLDRALENIYIIIQELGNICEVLESATKFSRFFKT